MAAHLSLVPNQPAIALGESASAPIGIDDVTRLLRQLAGPGLQSRAHLAARAAAVPTGAVTSLRVVR